MAKIIESTNFSTLVQGGILEYWSIIISRTSLHFITPMVIFILEQISMKIYF